MAAQEVSPTEIVNNPSLACDAGTETETVSITLPEDSTVGTVDVFLLFDDTGSFAGEIDDVRDLFNQIVEELEMSLPAADLAFGVGRFEDYGGSGNGFSGESEIGRPFILNQAIIRSSNAGFDAAIDEALSRTAPGFGGDGPESAIEALFQAAAGTGFDGDGNGSVLDSGPAGAEGTQTAPGTSGDVPDFESYTGIKDGSLGGVGWRPDALHLLILATDFCPVSVFDAPAIPGTITGVGGASEPASAFSCSTLGRFGFVSDSKSTAGNTIAGAEAPLDAATVPDTIAALNDLGIRVIGLAAPPPIGFPGDGPSTFLPALARLTGAVDGNGQELVFDIDVDAEDLSNAIIEAVESATAIPIDIGLEAKFAVPLDLTVTPDPESRENVGPGQTATFDVTFTGGGSFSSGMFDLDFFDVAGGGILGTIPVTLVCPVDTLFPQADVASDPGGEFLVAGEVSDGDGKGIFGQLYDVTGTPLTGLFQVNANSAGEQMTPAVTYLGDGRYVIAYVDGVAPPNSVMAQIVDAAGPVGASIQVAETDAGCDVMLGGDCLVLNPSVSADPAGNFVVAWDADDFGRGSFGRRFGPDGVPQTDVFLIYNEFAEDLSVTPDVAVFDDGSFVAVVHQVEGGVSADIFEIHFDSASMPAPASQINLYTPESQAYPNVSALAGGGYVALWESGSPGDVTGTGIFGRIDPTDPMQPEFQVNSIVDGDQAMPDVAGDAIGGFGTVWLDRQRNEIIGQRFDNTGDLVDGEIRISGESGVDLSRPRVAALPEQKLVAVWGAEGTQMDPDGQIFVEVLEPTAASQCVESDTILCLNANRFRLQARWTAPDGTSGEARASKLNVDSGYFWFFSPDNVELAVKVLQACNATEPCYWVFAGGMTDVEVELSVIDTLTGELKTYVNPQGQSFVPVIDTVTFKSSAAGMNGVARGVERGDLGTLYPGAAVKSESTCGGSADALCLNEDRFRIEMEWQVPSGDRGAAHPVTLTEAAGYFWFFSPNNLEAVFKILDGCAINGHYWIFGTGLTNLEVRATVTDTESGAAVTYFNPQGHSFDPVLDTEALATCP